MNELILKYLQQGVEISLRPSVDGMIKVVMIKEKSPHKFQNTKVFTDAQFKDEYFVVSAFMRCFDELEECFQQKVYDQYTNCHGCGMQLDFDCECRNEKCDFYISKEREETKWQCGMCGNPNGCPLGECLFDKK